MDLFELFQNFFDYFNITDDLLRIFLIIYIISFFVYIILKIMMWFKMKFEVIKLKFSFLEVKDINNIKNTKSRILNKIIKNYINAAQKGIYNVNAESIVNNQIYKMNFIVFNYINIEEFLKGFEYIFLMIGILMWAVYEYNKALVILSCILFLTAKLIVGIFNSGYLKIRIKNEIVEYIESEIGKFFLNDSASSIHDFKTEMKEIFTEQTKALKDSVLAIGENIANAVIVSNNQFNKNIEKSFDSVKTIDKFFEQPLNDWKQTIEEAAKTQKIFNDNINLMKDTAKIFNDISSNLSENLLKGSNVFNQQSENIVNEIDKLKEIIKYCNDEKENNKIIIDSLKSQMNYINENQNLLKESIQKYEISLENITSKMGDSFESIFKFQLDSVYKEISEFIKDDINNLTQLNKVFTEQLSTLFEDMMERSKNETKAIIKLKEEMEMYFERN